MSYLILHKVRGEPAFDIADKLTFPDGEEGWIIPTSGHRAYPCQWWLLEDLFDGSDYPHDRPHDQLETTPTYAGFIDLPDHYTVSAERRSKLTGLMQKLGLSKPKSNLALRGF